MHKFLTALTLLAAFACGSLRAQQPRFDPPEQYNVTPQAGAFMICAASFTGPGSGILATELVEDLRKKYKLPTYLFNRSRAEQQRQRQEWENMRKLVPRDEVPNAVVRHVRIPDQYAVLVGGYKDQETARKALTELRKITVDRKFCDKTVTELGTEKITIKNKDGNATQVTGAYYENPFNRAFVVPNPTVPVQRVAEKAPDAGLRKINEGEDLSVYHCRKPWTMVVAVFQGAGNFNTKDERTLFDKMFGLNKGEPLAASGVNAHNLCAVLRNLRDDKGRPRPFEAYVLHTRHASVVTVGGFDGKDDPRMRTMEASVKACLGANPAYADKFLHECMPMEVPRD